MAPRTAYKKHYKIFFSFACLIVQICMGKHRHQNACSKDDTHEQDPEAVDYKQSTKE
jgi:hypothetical protein